MPKPGSASTKLVDGMTIVVPVHGMAYEYPLEAKDATGPLRKRPPRIKRGGLLDVYECASRSELTSSCADCTAANCRSITERRSTEISVLSRAFWYSETA